MKILCVFGEHNYGEPLRGQGYEYTNFIPALRSLGNEVVFFESLNKSKYKDFSDLNISFLKTVEREQPDIILCVLMHYELWSETLNMIRQNSNIFLINWSTDDSWKYEQFSKFVSPLFHLYATTYAPIVSKSLKEKYLNFALTQWGANAQTLQEPLRAAECRYQVTFIGSSYGSRPKLINDLKRNGIHVHCFGHGWENGPIDAAEIPKIIRESVISLNFSDSGGIAQGIMSKNASQIKARVFEVTGAGGFLLTQNADNIDQCFIPGKEIIVFDEIGGAAEKIKFFLSNPDERDRIAWAGFQRTNLEHTYDMRFKELLDTVNKQCGMRENKPFRIDYQKFAAFERHHQLGYGLRLLKKLITYLCIVIWGKQRGPRAARKIIFELSWRLFGSKTYSAAGWPGRMFYMES
jgi:spore maturation protein CgeB